MRRTPTAWHDRYAPAPPPFAAAQTLFLFGGRRALCSHSLSRSLLPCHFSHALPLMLSFTLCTRQIALGFDCPHALHLPDPPPAALISSGCCCLGFDLARFHSTRRGGTPRRSMTAASCARLIVVIDRSTALLRPPSTLGVSSSAPPFRGCLVSLLPPSFHGCLVSRLAFRWRWARARE